MDDRRQDLLEDAVTAWSETSKDETLSSGVRSALFTAIQGNDAGAFAFAKAWRFALLGAIPVVVLSALLVAGGSHDATSSATGLLTAKKVDGQVVFTLANGGKPHKVYLSTDPQRFDAAVEMQMTHDRFQVDAAGGPNLVFYRID